MEAVASVMDKLKGFAKSSCDFVVGLAHPRDKSYSRNPIEILKRLQREAFSDLMKLRDRQDKVERVLSFYKTSKGSPFQEASTIVRGKVDVLGAILLMGDPDQQCTDALDRAGIRTGIGTRFAFETSLRAKDTLLAEFAASQQDAEFTGHRSGGALSLAKVSYRANVNDWLTAIAIPIGAQCRDFSSSTTHQEKGLTDLSSIGPPLLNQQNGCAFGLTVKSSNVIASLAQSVSGPGMQTDFDEIGHHFGTFGQLACPLPRRIRLSLMGLLQVPKLSRCCVKFGALTIPMGFLKRSKAPESLFEASAPPEETISREIVSTGSVALRLESEFDENTRIEGWIEMKDSNPKNLQWAVTMTDDSEDEFGWGMSFSGMLEGPKNWEHLQIESYVKLNLGKKFCLKPGVVYATDRDTRMLALMLRSNLSF
ncbi:hypothetical protein HS088_TW06G01371 [Tripterygium wilfordii]|uniref:Uncharacterized protein n=1 Tax=Tripterygium wilfordii TaxID=458696 RepID=A0A7J7DLE5_TRIWF|nr:uncharacterized protein LOC120000297 [Tripterygium wilfordii]KAF5747190.1 hypothetical protein HS088_TW06G01371 [Tripterygium wilfordii]